MPSARSSCDFLLSSRLLVVRRITRRGIYRSRTDCHTETSLVSITFPGYRPFGFSLSEVCLGCMHDHNLLQESILVLFLLLTFFLLIDPYE